MTETVGRPEFDALVRRVEQMDQQGTRGVAGVAIQLANAISDIGELRADFKEHEHEHVKDREQRDRERTTTRRFRITATIGASASVAAVLGVLADIASHVH